MNEGIQMGELFERVKPARSLEWTGERFTTEATGQVEVEHLHRYFLARHLAQGLDVLDIASGEGYGSALLAQTARSVVGVDIDRAAVEHARAAYLAQNLRFEQGSAQSIPLPDQSVDCVVSFETIEHFSEQKQFLSEIKRVLRPGGKLIVSSPNCEIYSPPSVPTNPYHIRELTRNELEKLLRANFKYVTLLAQRPIVGSVIVRGIEAEGPFDSMTFEHLGGDRYEASTGLDSPLYYVAIASDIALPSLCDSFFFEQGTVDEVVVTLPALRLEHQRLQESLRSLENSKVREVRARAGGLAAEIESLRAELVKYKRRAISWDRYDAAYAVWKSYKKKHIDRHEALKIIRDKYRVPVFFLLYPLYKIVKPFRKLKRSLENKICPTKIKIERHSTFDPSKRTMLLVSHEASQTGAPILAFNLLEKFASRYNVISVLLGPGSLENAFRNLSFATVGPFEARMRYTHRVHDPILAACRRFAPAFAIVNSIESCEALIPISKAKVPSVLLVHEFISFLRELDMAKVVTFAGQMVFSARPVWEDAVEVFPPLAGRPANIITQGPSRIPREWLSCEPANDEYERMASVMRPLGADDNLVVVAGCGTIEFRKGVDLFISVASALQARSPSRRFRFVWVGKDSIHEPLYSRYLAAQIDCRGLQETVKFLGEVNSLEPVYAMADIFLLSSRLDPFPNVAIDAMLAGLPVICFSNGSGVADMLSNHFDLKRLVVPCADASSAAEIIEQLSADDSYYQATRTAIRDLALSTFDMDRYVERLDQVAERAILIRRQEEEDAAAINRSDIFTMEYVVRPGSRAPRETCIKSFVRESAGFGGTRCPFPGFHPGIYRRAHPELNAPPFVNPLAHFIRSGEPKGPWLLDIITPVPSPSAQVPDQRAALHLHIHYPDLTPELFRPIAANQTRTDIFVTVSSDEGQREVTETAAGLGISIKDITVVPNRGRDVGPLLTLLGRRLVKDYDIIGHLHAKKSLSLPGRLKEGGSTKVGADWRSFCIENLLGGKHAMMDVILGRFARNLKLGLVFPCDPNTLGWTLNRPHAIALLERMGIVTELPQELFFPMGTMFWARTDAIAPLLEIDLAWSDYPFEPVAYDGTILHAIERLFPVVAQHRGFEIAGTYVPGVTR